MRTMFRRPPDSIVKFKSQVRCILEYEYLNAVKYLWMYVKNRFKFFNEKHFINETVQFVLTFLQDRKALQSTCGFIPAKHCSLLISLVFTLKCSSKSFLSRLIAFQ